MCSQNMVKKYFIFINKWVKILLKYKHLVYGIKGSKYYERYSV